MNNYLNWILPAIFVAFFIYRWWRARAVKDKLPELRERGAQIVDVRTAAEFATGHADGSINIPVQALAAASSQLDKTKPIVLCCASGTRSGLALTILKGQGFKEVFNAGPWTNI